MTQIPRHLPPNARGIGLVTAIFLLVVLAGLGVAMVSIYTSQQSSSTLDVRGARAYQAARAGIEWGLFRQLRSGAACDGSETSFVLPAGTSLSAFTVTVVCRQGSTTPPTRTIESTACSASGARCPEANTDPDYVQRKVEVQI